MSLKKRYENNIHRSTNIIMFYVLRHIFLLVFRKVKLFEIEMRTICNFNSYYSNIEIKLFIPGMNVGTCLLF